MMGPIASRFFSAFVLLGIHSISVLADDQISQTPSDKTALPEFIPTRGRADYAKAINENSAGTVSARRAAEAFSEITTSSISKGGQGVAVRPKPRTVVPDSIDVRSIVLTANQLDDPKNVTMAAGARYEKSPAKTHQLPRRSLRKKEPVGGSDDSEGTLASIGQKVGFLDLLTNPALWK
ncbi:MAG: hypothetical protein JSR99_07945 [Proteobacteria bacterium]|nr:hypothetical protein [Pseudomonadota bacterium]